MEYILSIVGIVFLGVMVDVISPEGKMNTFIKSIFAVFLLFVMINPVINLVSKDTIKNVFNSSFNLDDEYLESVNEMKIDSFEKTIIAELEKEGIMGVSVEIQGDFANEEISVEKVIVNTQNLVLINEDKHINKYKVITELIENILGVKSEVIIYE